MEAVIDKDGRLEIPSNLRQKLGLVPGTVVNVDDENGRMVVEPSSGEKTGLVEVNGRVVFYGKMDPNLDLNEFIRQSREDMRDGSSRS
jgi:AbrB family looped-hinge helix DNA binding protein